MTMILLHVKPPKTATEIISNVEADFQSLSLRFKSTTSSKYRHFVLKRVRECQLDITELKKIAVHLGIDWLTPPASVPQSWIPSICEQFMSLKYSNPKEDNDYIILISSRSIFGVKGVIRHTPKGYLDNSWFTDFVPILAETNRDYENAIHELQENLPQSKRATIERTLMSRYINDPINLQYPDGMEQQSLRSLHGFFKAYVPGIEGICKKCFKLQMPDSGLGESWRLKNSEKKEGSLSVPKTTEVRLSLPKMAGKEGQRILYVTHQLMRGQDIMYVKYEGIVREPSVKWLDTPNSPKLADKVKMLDTHIPWEIYDYSETVSKLANIEQGLPLCQCPPKKI